MADPEEHCEPLDDPLDDAVLDHALDGGFAAAREIGKPGTGQSVLDQIGAVTGAKPSVSLRDVEPAGETPMLQSLSGADGEQGDTGKYKVLGMLGRGGVGAVHRGHDTDLGRDVAMKFLHQKYKEQPAVLRRFVEEAQIGGQLQHPGIVPVYELGMSQGRPYFTMKLVKGKTLAKRLAERASPAADRRMFLSIFEDVCQTMAYAHARGVVHRDLKPANVMIGSFGEVQVVDWGMGKVLQHGGGTEKRAAELQSQLSVIETVRSTDRGTQSIMGSVMGTPAYMPPEQARGDVDQMDERSDVFSLGAILCEILTGKPPYIGEQDELIGMAAMAKLDDAHARLSACGAEVDLVELATHCLMPAPAARPRSAEVVARAVHQHLAAAEARIHEARVEAAEAKVRATALKRTQKLSICLTVVIGAGLAASLWFWRDANTQRMSAEQSAKEANEANAKESTARAAAETNLANFNRLAHVVRLGAARANENSLYPAWPDKADVMRAWLNGDAGALRDALPELRATLTALEERALPQAEAEVTEPQQAHPRAAELGAEVERRRAWRFADAADQFLHGTLDQLVADIEAFSKNEVRAVEQRLSWAERVEELTITRHRERWSEARLAILAADGVTASKLYATRRFELKPQMGLVPIGMNPQSKLWEFYHLRSGWDPETQSDPGSVEVPTYDEAGKLDATDRGVVFVLIPGGQFSMGAQSRDANAPNYDPAADRDASPVSTVELAPYLLSKFEMTQGQWARLSGGEYPSWFKLGNKYTGMPVRVGDSHPVEQVSWDMCDALLARHGLLLPTEAQWERGCRGGTSTPWCTGGTPKSLEGFANVLDQTGQNVPPVWSGGEAFDDRFKGPAPVGTYDPNAFGLCDVHGNVWEWCRDWLGPYTTPPNPGDGLRDPGPGSGDRVNRGGSCHSPARHTRAAVRLHYAPAIRSSYLGVRPAREITL